MKLSNQSFEILEQEIPSRKLDDRDGSQFREEYINNMYKHIERCGKTCYKSEHTIKEGSAERFINRLINSGHLSVLEHGVVYLKFPNKVEFGSTITNSDYLKYEKNPYTHCNWESDIDFCYVTTSYRVIIENKWEKDLQYLCEPTPYHEKRHTVLLHTCIHVYKDLTRHRKMSFSIESTRYCNYSKDKFGGEIKFILPSWFIKNNNEYIAKASKLPICKTDTDGSQCLPEFYFKVGNSEIFKDMTSWNAEDYFKFNCLVAEWNYNSLIEQGWQAQQAAEVLPQCTAADVVMSGFDKDWKFVFDLRSDTAATGQPHPLVKEIMTPLRDKFIENKWI